MVRYRMSDVESSSRSRYHIPVITLLLFCLGYGPCFAADLPANEGVHAPPQYSEERLRNTYDALPQNRKTYADGLDATSRNRYLGQWAKGMEVLKAREMEKGPLEKFRRTRPEPYQMDASLEEAYRYWSDWQNRRQDDCRRLFEDYLKAVPDTPFRAEICIRIAQVYSTNRNERLGDTRNRRLAETYWQMAHDLYGEKWSYLNKHAWATLVNYRRDIPEGKRYYDWLQRLLKEGSAEDIYPLAEMGQCLEGSRLNRSLEHRQRMVKNMKENLPGIILVTEKNLFSMASEADLEDLARSYPDTELGRQARRRLDKRRSALVEDALRDVIDSGVLDDDVAERMDSLSAKSHESEPVSAADVHVSAGATSVGGVSDENLGLWKKPVVLGVTITALLAAIVWLRFHRRKSRRGGET